MVTSSVDETIVWADAAALAITSDMAAKILMRVFFIVFPSEVPL
jgi:hypothetical protein